MSLVIPIFVGGGEGGGGLFNFWRGLVKKRESPVLVLQSLASLQLYLITVEPRQNKPLMKSLVCKERFSLPEQQ